MVKKPIKALTLITVLGIVAGVVLYHFQPKPPPIKSMAVRRVLITPTPRKTAVSNKAIFVPYWQLDESLSLNGYNSIYYFGISATSEGVSFSDAGYKGIKAFSSSADTSKAYLTLRMLNNDENMAVLKSKKAQAKVISETLKIAKDTGFKGVVLDLELGVLPFSEVVDEINTFVKTFYSQAKNEKVILLETMYGDVFYRKRPFDVKTLGQDSDGLVIMAYDFHKAAGEPGPNFPLSGKEKYGYDFHEMMGDFLSVVPAEKLTVVFGMYGYDWKTDMEGRSSQAGKSITLNEINQKYVAKCDWDNCVFRRDPEAGEIEINYNDSQSATYIIYHKLWYEDQKSVAKKIEFLQQQGVGSIGYWAYGYF